MHWLFDFVCQNDNMAINKSNSNYWLSVHVLVYSVGLVAMGVILLPPKSSWYWIIGNAIAHWVVDWCTSRVNARLYTNHRHWFFVNIGLDQLIHYACLLLSLEYFK